MAFCRWLHQLRSAKDTNEERVNLKTSSSQIQLHRSQWWTTTEALQLSTRLQECFSLLVEASSVALRVCSTVNFTLEHVLNSCFAIRRIGEIWVDYFFNFDFLFPTEKLPWETGIFTVVCVVRVIFVLSLYPTFLWFQLCFLGAFSKQRKPIGSIRTRALVDSNVYDKIKLVTRSKSLSTIEEGEHDSLSRSSRPRSCENIHAKRSDKRIDSDKRRGWWSCNHPAVQREVHEDMWDIYYANWQAGTWPGGSIGHRVTMQIWPLV